MIVLPGSATWLLQRVDLCAQAKLRAEVRILRAQLDASFVGFWVGRDDAQLLAFAGEGRMAPAPFPILTSSLPSDECVRDMHGTSHNAFVYPPQLGARMPAAGLMVIGSECAVPTMFDAMEACGAKLELIVAKAVRKVS
jgi:hypothetical protein